MKEKNNDKLILVTGGTGGLGAIVTRGLLDLGYRCVVPYRSEREAEKLLASLSQSGKEMIQLLAVDALHEEGVRTVFEAVDAGDKRLYALVHLLGGIKPLQEISKSSVEDWDFVHALNVRSYFLFAREAMQRFEKYQKGRIISIGAKSGIQPSAKQSTYGLAKSSVIMLTKIIAEEGKRMGVTANCIAPGIIATPANLEWGSEAEIKTWVAPQEIAEMIFFLLSPEAGSVTGSVIEMGS